MTEVETSLDYFMHYLAPPIVSGIVAIFCFWLGVEREKRKDKKKEKGEIIKRKENVILSLWEIGICAEQNKKSASSRTTETREGEIYSNKSYLLLFPLDFYEIAKEYNFFDFNYDLKGHFLTLKSIIVQVNEVIKIYNNVYGRFKDEGNWRTEQLKQNEEQIIKCCESISDIYKKVIVSEYLVVPMMKHLEILDEMKNKVNEVEKEKSQSK